MEVCELTRRHYEPGNQSRSYYAVWRTHIEPRFGICYRTYLSYINTALSKSQPQEREPTLFD